MLSIQRGDDSLRSFVGADIASEVVPGVRFHLERRIAKGGMGVAFLALRRAPEGEAHVIVKVLKPSSVRKLGKKASLIARKEAVALGRLNEQVPPTPFVVRLIDTGSMSLLESEVPIELPWTAVEHVPGGPLGTTLSERVRGSVKGLGWGFDPARAANAIESIAQGLAAVHEVGVIHRDLTPGNVLCTGVGKGELFKLADFGVARPIGFEGTFGAALIGTPGYAAPEVQGLNMRAIGTWTDVFGFAATIFFLLTGDEYFDPKDPSRDIMRPERRSVLGSSKLHKELRARGPDCQAIDRVLAWATAFNHQDRLAEALAVSAMIAPHLRSRGARPLVRISSPPQSEADKPERWTWTELHHPTPGMVIRSVAWDGYGRCFAATSKGLSFWNGTSWREARVDGIAQPDEVRFVRRIAPGRWVLGGESATLAVCNTGGVTGRVEGPATTTRFHALSGDLDDMAVLVGSGRDGLELSSFLGNRWLKPLPLPGVVAISGVARVDDALWMLCGRGAAGSFAALYAPLAWELEPLPTPPDVRAFLACRGQPGRRIGIATGLEGSVLWREGATTQHESVEGRPDLSAAGIDALGRGWAAGAGRIFVRDAGKWRCVWQDAEVRVPIISIFADSGVVVAMTADGGVIEGRSSEPLSDELSLG